MKGKRKKNKSMKTKVMIIGKANNNAMEIQSIAGYEIVNNFIYLVVYL